jgi:hypothetical protein
LITHIFKGKISLSNQEELTVGPPQGDYPKGVVFGKSAPHDSGHELCPLKKGRLGTFRGQFSGFAVGGFAFEILIGNQVIQLA